MRDRRPGAGGDRARGRAAGHSAPPSAGSDASTEGGVDDQELPLDAPAAMPATLTDFKVMRVRAL
jgi:hypothetical protein